MVAPAPLALRATTVRGICCLPLCGQAPAQQACAPAAALAWGGGGEACVVGVPGCRWVSRCCLRGALCSCLPTSGKRSPVPSPSRFAQGLPPGPVVPGLPELSACCGCCGRGTDVFTGCGHCSGEVQGEGRLSGGHGAGRGTWWRSPQAAALGCSMTHGLVCQGRTRGLRSPSLFLIFADL